ncbi:MAG: AMIN domain-containing protein [Desulfobulbaceae bacterium]|nr:AMIN domain-containing protein [Desulfobulbaceae bacterium]
MKISASIVLIQLTLMLLFFSQAPAATEPLLEDITFSAPSENEERITFKLNGPYIPKIFAMKGERPRVVFDFPDTKPVLTINNIIETNGRFVKQIRMGIHKGEQPKTRIVFDLVPDKPIDFEQNFDQQSNTLVVSVYYEGSEPAPAQEAALPEISPIEPVKEKTRAAPVAEELKVPLPDEGPSAVTEPTEPPSVEAEQAPPVIGEAPAEKVAEMEAVVAAETEKEGTAVRRGDESPMLHSVEFDNSSNRGEMVQFKLNNFYPPIVFGIEEGLPRIVCDFKKTRAADTIPNVIKAQGRYVKTIRIGKHRNPDKIRVVLDLEPNNNYDLQQVFFKEDNLFVIIVNSYDDLTAPVEQKE